MRRWLGSAAVVVIVALTVAPARAEVSPEALQLPGAATSATDPSPVTLSADLYLPTQVPAPAVVLAHGFGGSKAAVAEEAAYLQERGFAVLAYSARGFGESTGLISMNSPQFEVADARRIVDYLSERPEIVQDGAGDPRVGVSGGSYGGALALLLAGYDDRIDAVVADITWNDLESSLFGQSARGAGLGVLKQLWTGFFFSAGLLPSGGNPLAPGPVTECGRFSPEWCAAYTEAATTGTVSPAAAELMAASSPASVSNSITAPTLIGGGQSDSLFPLAQANANAEQISAANPDVPVKVVWHAEGHDGGVDETERLRALGADWLSAYLADGPAVSTAFEVSEVSGSAVSDRAAGTVDVLSTPDYPGLYGQGQRPIPVRGPTQQILAPAGGVPAAVTALPGAGGLAGLASSVLALPLPGQSAGFLSEPLAEPLQVIGSPRVRLQVSSDRPVKDAVLFASLRIADASQRQILPNGLVAPIRLAEIGPEPVTVEVDLPAIVTEAAAGDRLAVVVATTDQAYRLPEGPAVYTVSLPDGEVFVPQVDVVSTATEAPAWLWPLGGLVLVLVIAVVTWLLRPRHGDDEPRPDASAGPSAAAADVPISVRGLVKRFKGGLTAVDGATFTVPPGVVLGLLGPNGAGKTTTMRMIMGLIRPTDGEVRVFGQRILPGSVALARIGSFVEGPGFLPYLSGRRNLELYWKASGRVGQEPYFDGVLEIAGLGSAVDRKVKTYSQGMRQRLGIAQAMLGMPDVLLLDEPTNGLDPPQIREMRDVLHAYAATGRTVIISSHLLSEVEQTCGHVVVMNRGQVIAEGTVAEFMRGRTGQRLEDVFLEMVGEGHTVVSS